MAAWLKICKHALTLQDNPPKYTDTPSPGYAGCVEKPGSYVCLKDTQNL